MSVQAGRHYVFRRDGTHTQGLANNVVGLDQHRDLLRMRGRRTCCESINAVTSSIVFSYNRENLPLYGLNIQKPAPGLVSSATSILPVLFFGLLIL